ncbi:ring finger protein [Gregarina niphandrodes]|uniref:Ring finger protein n=1 Tax=Gregarina niphandrodes TaxID=110365 RepID=A0A023B987_GRENI|nr:ring finger protein [Gregarina niphandrodes]EZG71757.1 ring finger protein [Gregarina niphandrodes]|eukprot:XP_011129812.1 ring finger protein [Gregarina niphandrodes]
MASLFGYLVVFILYTTFFALKATTTFSGWISLMSPPSLVRLPPLGARTSRVQSVPPRCLESFPTLVWQTDWKVRSVEDLKHSTSSSMCLVCLQSYAQDETLRVLPCAHAFHAACIDEWLATHVECPIRCQVTLTEPFEGRFDEAVLERNLPPQAIESLRNVEYLHSAA